MLLWACPNDLRTAVENGLTALDLFSWMATDGTDDGACPVCPECHAEMVVAEV